MTATEQRWCERVSAWRSSGLSAREFSVGQGFTAGGLFHWAHILKKRGLEPRARTPIAPALVRLARVERSGVAAPGAASLTVDVGASRVSIPSGFDEATVRAVIGALLDGAKWVGR